MKQKIISSVVVMLLLTSSIVGMSGNAAAVHDCDSTDALVYGFSFGQLNKDKCTNNHVDHAVEEVRDAETQQDKVDLYSAASAQKARSENFEAVYSNYLQDTESVAWMKAEAAVAEAYENGSTKAEAKTAAREAIAKYYNTKQINLINSWNTTVTGFDYIEQRRQQEGISESFVVMNKSTSGGYDTRNYQNDYVGVAPKTVTLVNGSSHGVTAVEVESEYWDGSGSKVGPKSYFIKITTGTRDQNVNSGTSESITWYGMQINAPNSNYDTLKYTQFEKYKKKWNEIETKNSNLQNEADTFVEGIWTDLEGGNIDTTDILNRNTQMFEYGTDSQQNGTYYDSIGAFAAMGLETPDLNGTGQMTVTDHTTGNTYDGLLFARNAPNGTWNVGQTYNATNIVGPVWFSTLSGDNVQLDGEFTVEGATTKDGDETSEVTTTSYNYQTSNTSELNDKYAELLELTLELQERSESVGGGGDTSDSTNFNFGILTDKYMGFPLWLILTVLISIAYVVYNNE